MEIVFSSMCESGSLEEERFPWAARCWSGQLGQWAKLKVTVQELCSLTVMFISRRRRGRVLGHPVFHFTAEWHGVRVDKPEQMADGEYLRTISLPRENKQKPSSVLWTWGQGNGKVRSGKVLRRVEKSVLRLLPYPSPFKESLWGGSWKGSQLGAPSHNGTSEYRYLI